MTKNEKRLLTSAFAVLPAVVAVMLFPGVSFATSGMPDDTAVPQGEAIEIAPATPADGVMVQDAVPIAPNMTDTTSDIVPIVPDASAPVPSSPDDFPPQPVSVSPAETAPIEAAPTTDASVITPMPGDTSASGIDIAPAIPDGAVPVMDTGIPPQQELAVPVPAGGVQQGVASGGTALGDTGAQQRNSGAYYDANSLVPDSALAKAGATGPRRVDPLIEPGGKYIVVERGARAGSFEGQYIAATRALKLGRYAAAMEMFEKLYKRNHRDPRVLMGLAVAQQGAGFNESAMRSYEDLLDVQPNNADAIVNLMGIMKQQNPQLTLQRLMDLRNKYPSNAGVPAQIGLVSAQMQNYGQAMQYLEIAATMQPTNPSHMYNMAIIADRKGDVSDAIKYYERALELDASYGDTAGALPRDEIYDRLAVLRRKV